MKNILRLLAAALLLGCGVTARAHTEPAHTIELKPRMCHAVVEAGELPAPQVRQLPYACSGRPQGFHDDWLWLRADGGELQSLPADWRLLVDQTRFASMRAIVVRADGSMDEHRFRSGQAQGNWAVGGFLRFDIDSGSAPVTEVHLGIERLVNLDTMRKIRAVAEAEFIETQILWVALASVFAGVVGASLAYTSFLYTGLRHAFLRQYAFWCLAVLAYGRSRERTGHSVSGKPRPLSRAYRLAKAVGSALAFDATWVRRPGSAAGQAGAAPPNTCWRIYS